MRRSWRAASSLAGLVLGGCSLLPAAPVPAPVAPPPSAGIVIRYFSGVLVLPGDWVFDGTALPGQVRFQGPGGSVRLGQSAELSAYLRYAQRTAHTQDTVCGLDVLRHGDGEPPLFLLRAGGAYALAYDRDETVVRRILETYCASVAENQSRP